VAPLAVPPWQEEDNLTRATRSFAQFFNGVIVDLETGNAETADATGDLTAELPTPDLSVDLVDEVD
jgi:hypothetical protein